MELETITEIELRYKVAQAKFGVADELAWATAIFAAAAVYEHWKSWVLAMLTGAAIFILATYRERKEYKEASKAYEQEK